MSSRGFLGAVAAALALAGAAPAQAVTAYDNTATFSGFGLVIAGAGQVGNRLVTPLAADDIAVAPGLGGQAVTALTFSTANFSGGAVTVRPLLRFYAADGAGGLPGTYLGGLALDPVAMPGG